MKFLCLLFVESMISMITEIFVESMINTYMSEIKSYKNPSGSKNTPNVSSLQKLKFQQQPDLPPFVDF